MKVWRKIAAMKEPTLRMGLELGASFQFSARYRLARVRIEDGASPSSWPPYENLLGVIDAKDMPRHGQRANTGRSLPPLLLVTDDTQAAIDLIKELDSE